MHADLHCVFFPDLLPWERDSVLPLVNKLSEIYQVKIHNLNEGDRKLQLERGSIAWVISRNWKRAALSVRGAERVYASVFGHPPEKGTLFTLLWRSFFNRKMPGNVQLLAHSPLNFRFFSELAGISGEQLNYMHLPFPTNFTAKKAKQKAEEAIVVGTFALFHEESNLNYFMNVAHYVVQKNKNVRFRILGCGGLYRHLTQMVFELGLQNNVSVAETITADAITDLDILLYVPLRNDHFTPVLMAAAAEVPVLSNELPGIEEFVIDGKTGFVIPYHETKPMGELVIRLVENSNLRNSTAAELKHQLSSRFAVTNLINDYCNLFFGSRLARKAALDEAA